MSSRSKVAARRFGVFPDARLDGAAAIAQFQAQKGLALARGAQFFFTDQEKGGDAGIGREIGDVGGFHAPFFFLPSGIAWLFFFLPVVVRRRRELLQWCVSATAAVST